MAPAYSLDLRERVVAAVAAGQSCRSVATTFMVSVASVVKWSQRHRAVGSPAALKMGGRRPYLVARERDWVLARIAEKPDLTLRALLKELADRGLIVSYYALWHFLQHEGVTFKTYGPPRSQEALSRLAADPVCFNVSGLGGSFSRPRWRYARSGPHKTHGVERRFLNQASGTAKVSPRRSTAQAILASLLARATTATL